jgi:syringomycin synthetase protein SyrE
MVPSHFIFLESLPLTANGKVDRKSLPAVTVQAANTEAAGDPPQGEIEQTIAQAWAEALGVASVRRNDNFFDLGGHSLTALQIAFKLRQTFNVEFSLQSFMETPLLSEQAKYLEGQLLEHADASLVDELIGQMEQERN